MSPEFCQKLSEWLSRPNLHYAKFMFDGITWTLRWAVDLPVREEYEDIRDYNRKKPQNKPITVSGTTHFQIQSQGFLDLMHDAYERETVQAWGNKGGYQGSKEEEDDLCLVSLI